MMIIIVGGRAHSVGGNLSVGAGSSAGCAVIVTFPGASSPSSAASTSSTSTGPNHVSLLFVISSTTNNTAFSLVVLYIANASLAVIFPSACVDISIAREFHTRRGCCCCDHSRDRCWSTIAWASSIRHTSSNANHI
jgi:hypothetical protein